MTLRPCQAGMAMLVATHDYDCARVGDERADRVFDRGSSNEHFYCAFEHWVAFLSKGR
jgi:hypothetical protein